jgi:hypothetical protein
VKNSTACLNSANSTYSDGSNVCSTSTSYSTAYLDTGYIELTCYNLPTFQPTFQPTLQPVSSSSSSYFKTTFYADAGCTVYVGELGTSLGTCNAIDIGVWSVISISLSNEYYVVSNNYQDSNCSKLINTDSEAVSFACSLSSAGYYTKASTVTSLPNTFPIDGALIR